MKSLAAPVAMLVIAMKQSTFVHDHDSAGLMGIDLNFKDVPSNLGPATQNLLHEVLMIRTDCMRLEHA